LYYLRRESLSRAAGVGGLQFFNVKPLCFRVRPSGFPREAVASKRMVSPLNFRVAAVISTGFANAHR